MRKARQNKQNKVRPINDKLYINNIQYIPEDIEGDSENDQIQNPNAKLDRITNHAISQIEITKTTKGRDHGRHLEIFREAERLNAQQTVEDITTAGHHERLLWEKQ